jgi:hypothetical protein
MFSEFMSSCLRGGNERMGTKSKVDALRDLIQQLADERPEFFDTKGQGPGNLDTNSFMVELRCRAKIAFGHDFAERHLAKAQSSAVDFYFDDEATIVEIALGLKNPNTEYEKDIFKALLAQECVSVNRLVLIGKPGACKTCTQPGRTAIREWAMRQHNLTVEVYDNKNNHC